MKTSIICREPALKLSRLVQSLLLALMTANLLAFSIRADEKEEHGEIRAAKERIAALLRESKELVREGKKEQAIKLEREAEELQARLQRPERKERPGRETKPAHAERDAALRHLEIMRTALPALLEADRKDSADLLRRAIRAREVVLEGRKDDEAAEIRKQAPGREIEIELLLYASDLWRKFGHADKAELLTELAQHMKGAGRSKERRAGERASEESAWHARQIEILRLAQDGLREGGKTEAAELIKRSVQARTVRLKRWEGEEARMVLEREPRLPEVIETLQLAASLWREFGHGDKAEQVRELAQQLRGQWEKNRAREDSSERSRGEDRRDHLAERIARLEQALERIHAELREIRKALD